MPEQIGVWQEKIDIDKSVAAVGNDKSKMDDNSEKMQSQIQQVAFFDLMTGNYDRHGKNLVFDRYGNLRPIDHGEILPNFELYKMHNHGRSDFGSIDSKLSWTRLAASKVEFSESFKKVAAKLDPNAVVSDLKLKAEEISEKIGIPEIAESPISEESWQVFYLHIIALKAGIQAGLSPKDLAGVFVKGELHQALFDTIEDRKNKVKENKGNKNNGNKDRVDEGMSSEDFDKAKQKVLTAIENGKQRISSKSGKNFDFKPSK